MKTRTRIQTRALVFPLLKVPALEQVVSLQCRLAPVVNHDLCLIAGSSWLMGMVSPSALSFCMEVSAVVGYRSLEVSPAVQEMYIQMTKSLNQTPLREGALSYVAEALLQMTKTMTTLSVLELLAFFVGD